jgi:hypothetical protein
VNCHDADVLSYLRKNPQDGESILVLLNMSNKSKKIAFDLKPHGIPGSSAKLLLTYPNNSAAEIRLDAISLPPFGTLIAAVK